MKRRRKKLPKYQYLSRLRRLSRYDSYDSTPSYLKSMKRPRLRNRSGLYDQLYSLPEDTKRTIMSIILMASSLLILLSLFELAGSFGRFINKNLLILFGMGRWYIPLLLLILGYFLARKEKYQLKSIHYLAFLFLIFSTNSFIHLIKYYKTPFDFWNRATMGGGGGIVGFTLSYPLQKIMGPLASGVVLMSCVFMSIFLFFNTSFTKISSRGALIKNIISKIHDFIYALRVKRIQEGKMKPASGQHVDTENVVDNTDESFLPKSLDIEMETASTEDEKQIPDNENIPEKQPRSEKSNTPLLASERARSSKYEIQLGLLNGKAGKPTSGDIKANQYIIKKTLENFHITAEMGEVNVGPTVTQYTLKPAEGVKLSKIVSLNDNFALALAAHPIRIEAPIPGRSLVGIEVPNQSTAVVPLRELLESKEFRTRTSHLIISLGKDVMGKPYFADLSKMPHLMIAGATGSGKSVCINAIIIGLLYQNNPDQLKFILIDPKRVELPIYNGIPHLITPVITDVKKTVNALRWAIHEMEKRFDLLSKFHKRDIKSYNRDMENKMPYIAIIIDELADLMAAAGPEIEGCIIRIAQMARAVGIHLIVATQRPSVDVLTGLIKANITSRIAFSVASLVDSRTILDMSGAEKLLGRGDMLFVSAEISKPKRLQGAYATDHEIKQVIDYLNRNSQPEYIPEVVEKPTYQETNELQNENGDDDPLLAEAKDVIMRAGKASASLLQRRLRVGYARAARLLDLLEMKGIIGPANGAKPREILIKENSHVSMDTEENSYDNKTTSHKDEADKREDG